MVTKKDNPTPKYCGEVIWTPSDFEETRQAARDEWRRQWWLTQSRERKAKRMDFTAVVLLLATSIAFGITVYYAFGGK